MERLGIDVALSFHVEQQQGVCAQEVGAEQRLQDISNSERPLLTALAEVKCTHLDTSGRNDTKLCLFRPKIDGRKCDPRRIENPDNHNAGASCRPLSPTSSGQHLLREYLPEQEIKLMPSNKASISLISWDGVRSSNPSICTSLAARSLSLGTKIFVRSAFMFLYLSVAEVQNLGSCSETAFLKFVTLEEAILGSQKIALSKRVTSEVSRSYAPNLVSKSVNPPCDK
ncbi:hypothetical protein T11_12411 [Trichinella zimbabwensis]|uniref:Uncharacterized protein n=1 Tax=Trichinella zimbabwensis TaxID=268475 RepID=A0A0V1I559_9BILA|nr:hypothetical protein T11_12411 [Trichinella zimbabwensis]